MTISLNFVVIGVQRVALCYHLSYG